jgi:hypothetical protein
MKTQIGIAALLVAMTAGCGDLNIPDLNSPGLETMEHPKREHVTAAATGLLIGHRRGMGVQNGYVAILGVLGREAHIWDSADSRFVDELIKGKLDPGTPAFGGNFWVSPYANIRNANILIHALDVVEGVTEGEKEAMLGFAKTIQALDFLVVINTHPDTGAPIDVDRPANRVRPEEMPPIESRDAVFAHIAALLEAGRAHLEAGGAAFPFKLNSGFAGFDAPAKFLQVNRAIAARVAVYRGRHAEALAHLGQSFLSEEKLDASDLEGFGVYNVYGTSTGDSPSGLNGPNILVHESVLADAEKKANGEVDDRVARKIAPTAEQTYDGVKSSHRFKLYPTNSSRVAIIRNEELILLRAEANLALQNIAEAERDLNLIRVKSGGLAERADLNASNALEELLEQRRYSLLFEGGHRWLDLRRHGKLQTLPKDRPNDQIHEGFPLPQAETDARKGHTPPVQPTPGD